MSRFRFDGRVLLVGAAVVGLAVGGLAIASRTPKSTISRPATPTAVQVNRFGQDPGARVGNVAISGECGDVTELVTQAARADERILSFGARDQISTKFFAGETDAKVLVNEFMQLPALSSDDVRGELEDLYSGKLLTSMVEAATDDSAHIEPMVAINLGGTIERVLSVTGKCDGEHAELELAIEVSNSAIATEDGLEGAWSITRATGTDRIAVSLVHTGAVWLVENLDVHDMN